MIQYLEKDFKSIINKFRFIDSWFWCRYSINPYNGCEFACTYCDSRSHKYHLHPGFDQTIYIKNNVKTMLDNRLGRARTLLPDVVSIAGTCDPYQPAEEKFENTRQCLEVLNKYHYPVHIGTKSALVTRDIDLLSEIGKKSWSAVSITITTVDPELSLFLEPNAPDPKHRLETIKQLKRVKDIHVNVNMIPIVPFLGDSDTALSSVVKAAKNAGADSILFSSGMTMRDNQAVWFFNQLKKVYPELIDNYKNLYNATITANTGYSGCYAPNKTYIKTINKKMFELCKKYDLPYRIKRFIPTDFRRLNYLLAEEFLNDAYNQQAIGKPWSNLFWAGQNIQNLKESIESLAARGELRTIRNVNEQLEARVIAFLDQHKTQSVLI